MSKIIYHAISSATHVAGDLPLEVFILIIIFVKFQFGWAGVSLHLQQNSFPPEQNVDGEKKGKFGESLVMKSRPAPSLTYNPKGFYQTLYWGKSFLLHIDLKYVFHVILSDVSVAGFNP